MERSMPGGAVKVGCEVWPTAKLSNVLLGRLRHLDPFTPFCCAAKNTCEPGVKQLLCSTQQIVLDV